MRLLYIHHSVGGALFADQGPVVEEDRCILKSHPEGGGLRSRLQSQGYEVHEASYGSLVGDKTDMFDWLPKFRNQMEKVLTCDQNDRFYSDDRTNQIEVNKSCYPNNRFQGEGESPGNPEGPELTVWNAKATMNELLREFSKRPDILFVYMTAPANAQKSAGGLPAWQYLVRKALGKAIPRESEIRQASLARQFNNWVKSPDGWLKHYAHKNVAVFDLFDSLTDSGKTDFSAFPSGDDATDSHPARAGNEKAAAEFVPFLNRSVHRAGLAD
jgi:hypothetical protein